MSEFSIEAQAYISRGWHVFPLIFKSKAPAIKSGFKAATLDQKKIESWFCGRKANIGIRTGTASAIAIIDIDPKNGGMESFELLKRDYALDVQTLTVQTGSGGLHLYYSVASPLRSRNGILPGIDIKADGGYVVAPPSIHPNGEPYFFRNPESSLKPFPIEVLNRVDSNKKQSVKASSDVKQGSRHNHLVSFMGRLRGKGLSGDVIAQRVIQENRERCSPPLGEKEVNGILNSLASLSLNEVLQFSPQTDLENAERFSAFSGGNSIFVSRIKKWFNYDGKKFVVDEGSETILRVKAMLRSTYELGESLRGSDGGASRLLVHARKSESLGKINALLTLAQAEMSLSGTQLNSDAFLFNVSNGTIDLRTGKIREHRREDRLTKIAEICYDPIASCPLWRRFLSEITGESKDLQNYLQRIVGYCMTGNTKEQSFWILFGPGGNGKSTFLDILKMLVGD